MSRVHYGQRGYCGFSRSEGAASDGTVSRGRPRKPAASKRSEQYGFRFTPRELERLRVNAAAAELTVADYVVRRCCR